MVAPSYTGLHAVEGASSLLDGRSNNVPGGAWMQTSIICFVGFMASMGVALCVCSVVSRLRHASTASTLIGFETGRPGGWVLLESNDALE